MHKELLGKLKKANYDVESTLGNSDISDVYKLRNLENQNAIVLKVIKGINSALYGTIFKREVGALTILRSCNNIVRYHSHEIMELSDGQLYGLVYLEYINGKNLRDMDVIAELGRKRDSYYVIKQIIEAIEAAHTNGIIHRDINPSNIIVDQDKHAKLIDFGISKVKKMLNTKTLKNFGTDGYNAPESREASSLEQSDLYSLGAVIYYIQTGNHPPQPNDFERILENANGIDVNLKNIINKLVKISLSERYLDIISVKNDFLLLYNQISKSTNNYLILIDTDKLGYMKRKFILQDKGYSELVNIELKNEFLDSYIFMETQSNEDDDVYFFYGNHIKLDCIYDKSNNLFRVIKVNKLKPDIREKSKREYFLINGRLDFVYDIKRVSYNNNHELAIETKNNERKYKSSANVDKKYKEEYGAWHEFLNIKEEDAKNAVLKIDYISFNKKNDFIEFEINENDYYNLDESNEELEFVYERNSIKRKKPDIIGSFEKIEIINSKYYLTVKCTNIKLKLPAKGQISKNYSKELALINRENKAISIFNREQYECASNLKSIFANISIASHLDRISELSFFNNKLDPSQRRAVRIALNSMDIALIQGPPGTGKTNVIVEIVRQIIKLNPKSLLCKPRILIVSQAHAAVNKMLEDIEEASTNYKILKIGREKDFTKRTKKYSIDFSKKVWIEEVKKMCKSYLLYGIDLLNIDCLDFLNYCICINECIYKNDQDCKSKILKSECGCYISEGVIYKTFFENTNKESIEKNKKLFNELIIQQQWISVIDTMQEIEQYYIKNVEIIAGTCTGVVSNPVINDMSFDYVIVDEAAKATYPELLIPLGRAKKIILVGDHKQLPPVLEEDFIKRYQEKFRNLRIDTQKLYENIFEKLYKHLESTQNIQQLNTQYRMHPCIGTMISNIFYDGDINNGIDEKERQHNIKPYDNKAIIWIDTSDCKNINSEKIDKGTSQSHKNLAEAEIVKEQLKLINEYSLDSKYDVGVITPYRAQKELINAIMQQIDLNNIKDEITINSVDAFQGSQKDIIIYSTVKTRGGIDFIKKKERLNVAFSRAKRLLIIIGNIKYLLKDTSVDNKFPDIIKYIKNHEENCMIINYNKGGQ